MGLSDQSQYINYLSCYPILSFDTDVLGLVLCSNYRTELESDYASTKYRSLNLAKLAQVKLGQFHLDTKISISQAQKADYETSFPITDLIVDRVDVEGLMASILSAHYIYPTQDLFVMACDLHDLNEEVFYQLLETFHANAGNHDFFCFQQDELVEPLIAIFTAQGLFKINNLILADALPDFSLEYIFSISNTLYIETPDHFKLYFKNHNSISHLER